MSRYNILLQPESKSPDERQAAPRRAKQAPPSEAVNPVESSPNGRVEQAMGKSTDQSTSRPTERSTSRIVPRPKAFYITERLDRRLDEAVRYFETVHGIKKADRSTIVNALLDHESIWSTEALDQLVDSVLSQLTSRLTG